MVVAQKADHPEMVLRVQMGLVVARVAVQRVL
jgi:hypothetical protein